MRESLHGQFESSLARLRARIVAGGMQPAALIVAAFAISLIALPLIAREYYLVGFAVFLLGRAIDFFAAAGEAGQRRFTVFNGIAYASVPFAFALADPTRGLAASFLLFGFVAVCCAPARPTRDFDPVICLATFAIMCFSPTWFGVMAYGLGIACFVITGLRLARRSP